MEHQIIAALKFVGVAVAAVVMFKWIERRALLAWLGVKSSQRPPAEPLDRMLLRFEKLRTSIWMFARLKVRLDPQFRELPEILKTTATPKHILDVGCGHGMVGGALLEWCPGARIVGIEPRKARVRSANAIFADRGTAIHAAAPDFPTANVPERFDLVLLLDVMHYIPDEPLKLTLNRLRQRITDDGTLIIRVSLPEAPNKSFLYRIEKLERLITWNHVYYRPADEIQKLLTAAGFGPARQKMSGTNRELCWFIASPAADAK